MEHSSPSKRATFFGSYDGERPTGNDIRMDGEWKYQRVRQGALGSEPLQACTTPFILFALVVADDTP